ncbi:TPA: hypothetical protein HA219_02725 [Candidatus Woesearchaeota archaeon]|nr:hypothetical protein [Candidatus Woesearchaeota archaeon]
MTFIAKTYCGLCHGTGVFLKNICHICKGTGRVDDEPASSSRSDDDSKRVTPATEYSDRAGGIRIDDWPDNNEYGRGGWS